MQPDKTIHCNSVLTYSYLVPFFMLPAIPASMMLFVLSFCCILLPWFPSLGLLVLPVLTVQGSLLS